MSDSLKAVTPWASSSHNSISKSWSGVEFQLVGVIFGFTLGFGYFVVCHAVKQTHHLNLHAALIWLGISSTLASSTIIFLRSSGVWNENLPYSISLILLWAIQLNCLFQIIVKRITMMWSNPFHCHCLRWGVLMWTLFLNIWVFCTWIPASIQRNRSFVEVVGVSFRVVRVFCFLTTAFLDIQFIYSVNKTLVSNGLKKYKKLMKFNVKLVFLSLVLDLLPLALLISRTSFLFLLLFPLTTMVKIKTELILNDLIVKIINSEHPLRVIRQSMTESSTLQTPHDTNFTHTRVFSSEEEAPRKLTTQELTTLNLSDVWKPPNMSCLLAAPPSLQMSKTASVGSFHHGDDMVDSIPAFAQLTTYSPSLDIRSEGWSHSRMSTNFSLDTDAISDFGVAHYTIEIANKEKTPEFQVL